MNAKSRIAASCPFNVTFYACDFGEKFLGCCENGSPASTCTNGCPQEDLLPASFEKVYYDYVTRAACTRGDWWSCADISPPFLGCCLSNPCLGGCPPSDLTAAIFSLNQTDNPLYSAIPHAPAAASSTTSSSTSTAASSTPVRTTGAAHSAITNPSPIQKDSTRRVVGDVVGAVLAVGVIFIGVLLLYRRLKSQAYKGSDSTGTNGKGSIKGILLNSLTIAASSGNLHLTATVLVPGSPTVSKASRQENEASHEFPTIANPREEARVPIRAPRSTNFAPCIENKILQQVALKKITKRTRHRKSFLQTTPRSPNSQVRTYPSRATSFRHLTVLIKGPSIRRLCSQVDLASGHTLPLAYPKPRSHMDSHSGLTRPPDYLRCLLLLARLRWLVACPLFLSPMTTFVQTSEWTAAIVSAVINNVEATCRGGRTRYASMTK